MVPVPRWIGWPLVGACSYGLCAFLANRAVYYPLKYPQGWWEAQARIGAEDVWLGASDGTKLHAWWVPAGSAPLATLFLHGNGGNITFRAVHAAAILSAGSAVLLLDYRGYGRSAGRPSERGLYADAEAGYEYLRRAGYPPERIVIHGESLGTAVAVWLAVRKACGGVVLESPLTSARDVAGRVLPLLGPLVVWGFNSKARIAGLRAPLLVIHGDRDETVPYNLGQALFAAAPEPKWFWTVRGASHNDIVETAGEEYAERLEAFYRGLR